MSDYSSAKDKLNQTLKNNRNLAGKDVIESQARNAVDATKNSLETQAGAIAGEINGGIQSLTQKFDKAQGLLNNTTTEGLLNSASKSIENLTSNVVDNLIGSITTPTTSKIAITFKELDLGNGLTIQVPDTSSLEPTGGADTISGVLKQITGLDVGGGDLQKQVLDASPDGLLKAGARIEGKIGAFTSESINSLATASVTSVTDKLEATGALADVNRGVKYIDTSLIEADSTQPNFGEVVSGSIATITPTSPGNTAEFNAMIANAKTKPLADLQSLVTKDLETRVNLVTGANDFSQLSGGKEGKQVIQSAQRQKSLRDQYRATQEERNSLVQSRVAGDGTTGIVQQLSVESLTEIRKQVKEFAPRLSSADINRVINLSQGNSQEFSQAVELLFQSTGKSAAEIRAFLKTLDTTITRATSPEITDTVFDEPYVIGSFAKEWKNGEGDPVFPYISSVEELQAEFKNIVRDVTEIVVHWTETPTNKNIGSEEINAIHLENGLAGIGYHYVIRRDGSLQRGRPVNIQGEHAVTNNHNERSIAVVFVGGINAPSETPNLLDFTSVQSLTRSQFNTFDHICRSFYNVFAGGQVVGHQDIDALTIDPGFDVRAYVKANFDKDSKFSDPLTQGPLTVDEINS